MVKPSRNTRYAARLNAFKIGAEAYWPGKNRITAIDLMERGTRAGLNAADLNYPDHFEHTSAGELSSAMDTMGITLNGLAMRYYTDAAFKLGAFTHPDERVRRAAIDITKEGLDALADMGGNLMTLWKGQDGFDYSFQAGYSKLWDHTMAALEEITAHNEAIDIAIEYRPNEPRAFALMPDVATTLLALKELGAANTGVTLDFAHVLYAEECLPIPQP